MRILLLTLSFSLLLMGCIAGPTPHPVQDESSGVAGPSPDPTAPSAGDSATESDASSSSGSGEDGWLDSADAISDTASDVLSDTASDVLSDTASDVLGDAPSDAATQSDAPQDGQSTDLSSETSAPDCAPSSD